MTKSSRFLRHPFLKNFFLLNLGAFLNALGVVLFFAPNQLVTGGPPGVAIIFLELFGVPLGITVFVFNMVLILMGAKYRGYVFFAKTVYAFVMLAVFIELLSWLLSGVVVTREPVLIITYGSILLGAGIALGFRAEAAMGGLSVACQMIAQRLGIPVGRVIQIIDGAIVVAGGFVFKNVETALWSGLSVYIVGLCVDRVLKMSLPKKQKELLTTNSSNEE